MNTTDIHSMKETLSFAKKGDFEPQEKSRYLCLANEIKFASSLLKLWRQLYFRVKSIIFYILGKHQLSFFPNAEMFAELPNSKERKDYFIWSACKGWDASLISDQRLYFLQNLPDFKMAEVSIFPIRQYHFLLPSTRVAFAPRRKMRIMTLRTFTASNDKLRTVGLSW